MKIMLVSGSSRSGSQSRRVTDELAQRLENRQVETSIVDLFETPVATVLDDIHTEGSPEHGVVSKITAEAESSDGFVIVTPEWGGMASPAVKAMFTVTTGYAHKPGLIVSVSASANGAYPVSDLRMSSYKNTKIVYIPDHLVLRNVSALYGESASGEAEYINERTDFSIDALIAYATAMAPIRDEEFLDQEKYAFGM